jgi:transcriptional regulator with XRE-family HTH domain
MDNEKELLKAFGAKVQHYRNKLGLSQEKFAEKANVQNLEYKKDSFRFCISFFCIFVD